MSDEGEQVTAQIYTVKALDPDADSKRRFCAPTSVEVESKVHPRKKIYRDFIKDYVTGTAGTGGSGKSILVHIEANALALGVDVFDEFWPAIRAGAQRVLMLSLEDDYDEFKRRQQAISRFFGFNQEQRAQIEENLQVIFDRGGVLRAVTSDGGMVIRDKGVIDYIKETITAHEADVLIIDPLVSFHSVDENRAPEMQEVVTVMREMADELGIAVHYVHHNRKGGEGSADAMRGSVALRDGSRKLRMVARIARDLAMKEFMAPEEEASYLMGVTDGKANFEPLVGDVTPYRFYSVDLDNEVEKYESDKVGVVKLWQVPDLFDGFSVSECEKVWGAVLQAEEQDCRIDQRANGWVGKIVARILDLHVREDKKRIDKMVYAWVKSGQLEIYEAKDSNRKKVEFVRFRDKSALDEL